MKVSNTQNLGMHRFGATIRFLLTTCLVMAAIFCGNVRTLSATGLDWSSGEVTLGSLSMEGGLSREFYLSSLSGSPEFSAAITLKHITETVTDRSGTYAQSRWEIPQLTTHLLPEGKDLLAWQQPGGNVERFDLPRTKEALAAWKERPITSKSGAWKMAQGSSGKLLLSSEEGWVYEYKDGAIDSLTAPTGRKLTFRVERGLITSISQVFNGRTKSVLTARLDANGQRVNELRVGADTHKFVYAPNTGRLVELRSNRANFRAIAFAYGDFPNTAVDKLLTGITYPDGSEEKFTWRAPVASWMTVDDLKMPEIVPGAVLKSDGQLSYKYGTDREGLNLVATDPAKREIRKIYNPLRSEMLTSAPDGTRSAVSYSKEKGKFASSRLSRVTGPLGEVLASYEYTTDGKISAVRRLDQPEMAFEYDTQRRLIKVSRAGEAKVHYTYADSHKLAPEESRELTVAALRSPTKVTDAAGNTIELTYDNAGQVVKMTDLNGGEHKFAYDEEGRMARHDLPMGYYTLARYDEFGRMVEKRSMDGSIITAHFNALNKVAGVNEQALDRVWQYQYDDLGRLQALVRDNQPWVKYELLNKDALARLETLKELPESAAGAFRATVITDPQGHQTRLYFDSEDRTIAETNALGETVAYRHDAATGDMLGWTDARGSVIAFEKDIMGRLVQQSNSIGQTIGWNYDYTGKLVEKTNGEQSIKYAYDEAGALKQIDYGAGQVVSFTRDSAGRMTSSTTSEVTTSYVYDALDRVVAKRQEVAGGLSSGIAYTYTAAGQKKTVAVFGQQLMGAEQWEQFRWDAAGQNYAQVSEYGYDQLGRVTAIKVDGTEKVRYNYDPSTLKLTSKVFSNGMKTEYSYDREGRIQGMALRDAAGRIQKAVGYQWNTYGQLATRYLKGFELPEAVFVPVSTTGNLSSGLLVQEYKYDAIGRLIAVECPDAPQLSESYAFDQSGNIVSKTVGGQTVEMTYDLANQLIAKSEQGGEATSFSYDAAGRMTGEAVKGVNVASYTYGYLDKVLSVNRQGSESARFQYDAAGMLVGKEKEGVRENWVWDGISLAARGKEVFVNEAHASGGVPIMASHLENGDDISADFLVNDYLGTTIASTSAESAGQVEGLLVASLGAGGDAAAKDNAGARFTGKPYDADMGAHVFPFRNYRTDIGRWMSSDPAGFPDGPNGHFYAPVATSGIDPLGLRTVVTKSGDVSMTVTVDWSGIELKTKQLIKGEIDRTNGSIGVHYGFEGVYFIFTSPYIVTLTAPYSISGMTSTVVSSGGPPAMGETFDSVVVRTEKTESTSTTSGNIETFTVKFTVDFDIIYE